jgi:hypothetical protein
MDNFIDTIQDGLEIKRQYQRPDEFSFSQKLKRLQPELRPVAKELQRLVEAKATLDTGDPFKYSIYRGPDGGNYVIILDFYPQECLISYSYYKEGEDNYFLSESNGLVESYGEAHYNSQNHFIDYLSFYLGERLGSLGLLDKQIYSKKTQDHLGI